MAALIDFFSRTKCQEIVFHFSELNSDGTINGSPIKADRFYIHVYFLSAVCLAEFIKTAVVKRSVWEDRTQERESK